VRLNSISSGYWTLDVIGVFVIDVISQYVDNVQKLMPGLEKGPSDPSGNKPVILMKLAIVHKQLEGQYV
jgi:hypothetical protein